MSVPIWDGVTQLATLTADAAAVRQTLADRAKAYDWDGVLILLTATPELVNTMRPGGHSRYTVLHQAAHGGAPVAVVEQLLALGAWRTIRTARGERPVDVAERRGHVHLVPLLTPALHTTIATETLAAMQRHFHDVIRGRAGDLVAEHALRLPELEALLEIMPPKLWFPVPGMYGGFGFWLDTLVEEPVVLAESWSRVVGGSGERHIISPHGSLLLAAGFV